MTRINTKECKLRARRQLCGKYGFFIMVTLVLGMLNLLLSSLVDFVFPSLQGTFNTILYLAISVLMNVIYYLLLTGSMLLCLNLCRGRRLKLDDLFFAFTRHPEPIAVYSVLQFLLQTVLYNAFIRVISLLWSREGFPAFLRALPFLFIGLLLFVWIQLGLSMVLYLYCDAPEKSFFSLLRESWQTMRGCRMRMLYLILSFWLAALLGVLSFGIGLLYVRPYLNISRTNFYLELCSSRRQEA